MKGSREGQTQTPGIHTTRAIYISAGCPSQSSIPQLGALPSPFPFQPSFLIRREPGPPSIAFPAFLLPFAVPLRLPYHPATLTILPNPCAPFPHPKHPPEPVLGLPYPASQSPARDAQPHPAAHTKPHHPPITAPAPSSATGHGTPSVRLLPSEVGNRYPTMHHPTSPSERRPRHEYRIPSLRPAYPMSMSMSAQSHHLIQTSSD